MDTSSLVTIQQTYPPAIFPDLWERLAELARDGQLLAPREVFNELRWGGDDDLRNWVEAHKSMFIAPDLAQLSVATEIVNDREFIGLFDIDAELPDADPFVVALAVAKQRGNFGSMLQQQWVVVADADGAQPRNRPRIPDVCRHPRYGVRTIMALDMLREKDFHLPPSESGLAALYGIWKGTDISEKDLEDVKARGREL